MTLSSVASLMVRACAGCQLVIEDEHRRRRAAARAARPPRACPCRRGTADRPAGGCCVDHVEHPHAGGAAQLLELGERARPPRRARCARCSTCTSTARSRPSSATRAAARLRRELVLERANQLGEVELRDARCSCVRRLRRQHAPLLASGFGGNRCAHVSGPSCPSGVMMIAATRSRRSLREVDEVVARQRLASAGACGPAAGRGSDRRRRGDGRGRAGTACAASPTMTCSTLPAPIDQDADLAPDLARALAQKRRQLGRDDLRRLDAAPKDALQHLFLRRRESLGIPGHLFHERGTLARSPAVMHVL